MDGSFSRSLTLARPSLTNLRVMKMQQVVLALIWWDTLFVIGHIGLEVALSERRWLCLLLNRKWLGGPNKSESIIIVGDFESH